MKYVQKTEPLVSVLITTYNREQFVAEAIESVLASDYSHFEVIIVDDHSKDNTVAICRRYEKQDSRTKVYVNAKNLGQFANRNKAGQLAKGKYLKYVDSDDTIFPWTLQYCVEIMEKYPDVGMGILYQGNVIAEEYLEPAETVRKNFFESGILHIGPVGTILNRKLFIEAGCFDTSYGVPSDMYFNLKMAARFPVVLLKKEFFYYRRHKGQEFNNRYSYLCNNYRYLSDAFNLREFPLEEDQKTFILKKAEVHYARELLLYLKRSGNFERAFKAIVLSRVGLFRFLRGTFNLILMKLGYRKYAPLSKEIS